MGVIQCHERLWTNPANGRTLFYRLWEPVSWSSVVVIVHGVGEHSGRYATLAHALAERGLAIACPDLWGHGRSAGRRGDIERFGQYLDDLDALASQVFVVHTRQHGIVVFGHSFGGLLTIHWVLRHPEAMRCLITQSPLLGVGFTVPKWKERLAGFLGSFWPGLALPTGLDPAWLTHDQAIVQSYRQDPYVHRQMSLRCYSALQEAMRQALERAGDVARPTLVLYGAADRVISVKACQDFFERLACEKRLMGFPGCFHELHHEPAQATIIEEVCQWVHAHV